MVAFQSPFGGVTVEVAEGHEAAYHAAGWPLVGVKAEGKYLSQQNKAELLATAAAEDIDVDKGSTVAALRDAIKAARK